LTAGYGMDVFEYTIEGKRVDKLKSISNRASSPDRRWSLAARQPGQIGDRGWRREEVEVELPDHKMDGPWGVGAQAGAAGIWQQQLKKE